MDETNALGHFARKFKLKPEAAKNLVIPLKTVNAARGMTQLWSAPGWTRKIGEAVDAFTRQFKTAVTVPFPSFPEGSEATEVRFRVAAEYAP